MDADDNQLGEQIYKMLDQMVCKGPERKNP